MLNSAEMASLSLPRRTPLTDTSYREPGRSTWREYWLRVGCSPKRGPGPLRAQQLVAQNDLVYLGLGRGPLHKRHRVGDVTHNQVTWAVDHCGGWQRAFNRSYVFPAALYNEVEIAANCHSEALHMYSKARFDLNVIRMSRLDEGLCWNVCSLWLCKLLWK